MRELVYSTQPRDFERGRHYENPRYFAKLPNGLTHVYIIGNWPKVVEACEEAGVEYTVLREGAPISWRDGVAPVASEGRGEYVEIEPTWKKFGAPRLIELAQQVAGRDDIKSRREAVQVIELELERRNQAEMNSPDDDEE